MRRLCFAQLQLSWRNSRSLSHSFVSHTFCPSLQQPASLQPRRTMASFAVHPIHRFHGQSQPMRRPKVGPHEPRYLLVSSPLTFRNSLASRMMTTTSCIWTTGRCGGTTRHSIHRRICRAASRHLTSTTTTAPTSTWTACWRRWRRTSRRRTARLTRRC